MLDEHQQRVVDWREGRVVVSAAAGSGKTFTLTERAVKLIEEGVPPERILTLVYNKRAQETFQARLAARLKGRSDAQGSLAPQIQVQTFHAFCLSTLHALAPHSRMLYRILGADSSLSAYKLGAGVLKEIAAKQRRGSPWTEKSKTPKLAWCLKIADQIRDTLIDIQSPDSLHAIADLPACGGNIERAGFAVRFAVAYQQAKQQIEAIDFADMIFTVCYLIKNQPAVAAPVLRRFDHVQCDEAQDFAPSRLAVTRFVAEGAKSWVSVGDPRQSINSFACADLDLFLDLVDSSTLLTLPTNRRSTAQIVELANTIAAKRSWEVGGPCLALLERGEGTAPEIWLPGSSSPAAAAWLAKDIQARISAANPPLMDNEGRSNYGVVVRLNSLAVEVELALTALGIPSKVIGKSGWASQYGKDVLAYLRAACGKPDKGLQSVKNKPTRYCTEAAVASALKDLDERINEGAQTITLAALLRTSNTPGAQRFGLDLASLYELPWRHLCKRVATFLTLAAAEEEGSGEDAADDAADTYRQLCASAEGFEGLEALEAHITSSKKRKGSGAVEIGSIHKAKGQEWDRVYVYGCDKGVLPLKNADEEEERRIFYVAATRAKSSVVFVVVSEPSRFLLDVDLIGEQEYRDALGDCEDEDVWADTATKDNFLEEDLDEIDHLQARAPLEPGPSLRIRRRAVSSK